MYVEITKEAFHSIVGGAGVADCVDTCEHARKLYYFEQGCWLLVVENFLSFSTQFYIQDINA